ncbi:MAG: PucR family transcriptional regulator ligand-binding domain-containing protein [Anaerolineaceae bacterium]|nr:PucR family transcriptional regulator ligand-binding domain-containing protein [Anaerolineaceae bacterium]
MLTVADALQLEQFQQAQAVVVAGEGGLEKPVTWVHIAAVLDAPQWLRGGELVLTTIQSMPEGLAARHQYIEEMAGKGAAGLAITVGRFLNQIPAELREVADRLVFPLIEISYQIPFIDLAKAANERIAEENMQMVTGALTIHQILTQLVLDGGDLKQLASRLAGLLGQSISIENTHFESLASANVAEVDEARRFTLNTGHTDPRLIQALEERGFLAQIRHTLRPVFIPRMADVGLELERILAPIVVHGDIYGYVFIIAHGRPLTDLDRVAIASGATIAALMMLYQESLQSAEASLKGSLLAQLIQGETAQEAVLTDHALRYGVDLSKPYVLLQVEMPENSSQRVLQVLRRVNRLVVTQNWLVVVGQFAGQVVVLAQSSIPLAALADQIRAECDSLGVVRVGISGSHRKPQSVSLAYQQCREVLHITRRLHDPAPVVYFGDLGYLHTLYRSGSASLSSNPYVPWVRRLLDQQQMDLFNTLEAYLDAGGNSVQTAKNLHIHRSTLNYRLMRVEEISPVRLTDPVVRTNLQIALKLIRLFETD